MRAAGGRAGHAEGPWPLPGLLLLLLLLPLPCPRRPFSPPDTGGGAASRSGLDLPRGLERCQMRVRMECWQVAGAKDEVGFHLPCLRTAPRADVASPPLVRHLRARSGKKGWARAYACVGYAGALGSTPQPASCPVCPPTPSADTTPTRQNGGDGRAPGPIAEREELRAGLPDIGPAKMGAYEQPFELVLIAALGGPAKRHVW